MDKEQELASEIIEEFEELLEDKEITIPSVDREGKDEEGRIFGREYYRLEDAITRLIKSEKDSL